MGQIASVKAYLDGNNIFLKGNNFNFAPGNPVGSYSAILNDSASALHVVNVTVLWYAYYRGPAYNGSHILSSINSSSGPVYQYPMVVSDIVYFTVVGGPSPSPSPSPQETEPFPTTLVIAASVIVIVAVGAGLLVYFKKHKR
jgi:hypothetical protein